MGKIKYYLAIALMLISFYPSISSASIILKLMSANPSKGQSQKVQVKTYLPKEAKPEHVIDKADLDIAYDTQQGSYYVYGEFELAPGETLEKDVELRDIWVISSSDIETVRADSEKLTGLLKNSEFAERSLFLKNSIDSKLNQIIENQKAAPANPERHISDYRDNLKILESARADVALQRSLLSQTKPFPAVLVWRVIIAIIIFLGLLGGIFYIVWQTQVKEITHDTFYVPKEEIVSSKVKSDEKDEDNRRPKTGDIEKIIEKEDET
jgi:hypothetical protein